MTIIHVTQSAEIAAPAERVYAILSDYRTGHPAILPPAYFSNLQVEQGGQGAGTVVSVEISMAGSRRLFRMQVSEPEPGRVLAETDLSSGVTTRFTVEPLPGGAQSRVTIASEVALSQGFTGLVERLLTPLFLRRVYREELKLLEERALAG